MSLHKLSAGSGYEYLTRQVAAYDDTGLGPNGLADYYAAKGEAPGTWIGSGLVGIDGLEVGASVTQPQMAALFGLGHHPLEQERLAALGASPSPAAVREATRLGASYPIYAASNDFHTEVAIRLTELNRSRGLGSMGVVSHDDRAATRSAVASDLFLRDVGRRPVDSRELAGALARYSRLGSKAVAGYDLTFSPPKSFSALWALASPEISQRLAGCHDDAVRAALAYVERVVLFTREGAAGVRQVDVRGLIGTAFVHRDSRAGDPDLHTHVAVANKVQTLAGKWLAIDGRVLYRCGVTASETYNTALAALVADRFGIMFEAQPHLDPSKLPKWELPGVPEALLARWSQRRIAIEARLGVLAADFQARHGRPPSTVESHKLAQQATLETRGAKHEARSLEEQRTAWRAEAAAILGSAAAVDVMLAGALSPGDSRRQVDADWFEHAATRLVGEVETRGATWREPNLRAAALRLLRSTTVRAHQLDRAADLLVAMAVDRCVPIGATTSSLPVPDALRRRDGSSVYEVAGTRVYTSTAVVAAERSLLAFAGGTGGFVVPGGEVQAADDAAPRPLNPGQRMLVRELASSGRLLQLAIAPAGAGKTVAIGVLAEAWMRAGHDVIGLAPSAAAASELTAATGRTTDTIAKLTHGLTHPAAMPTWANSVGTGTLVVIDEAGMVDTISLHQVVAWAIGRGAVVRLVGDDQQLAAIGSGGILRDIATSHGAVHLSQLMRFTDPAEAAASLALRDGRTEALGFYLDKGRIHVGDLDTLTRRVFEAWRDDTTAGLESLMLAPTKDLVVDLDTLAQHHRISTGQVTVDGPGALLSDGHHAWVGDVVVTRANRRDLPVSRTDWVKNGDRWTITGITTGGIQVHHSRHHRTITLPAWYVTAHVELGYAGTVHTAQGVTSDTVHGILTGREDRQLLYTMLTRGRRANHAYLDVVGDGSATILVSPEGRVPDKPTDVLEQILARDASATSATTQTAMVDSPAARLGDAVARYTDGITIATAELVGPARITQIETYADQLIPGIADDPAWATLRHRLLTAALDHDPRPDLAAISGTLGDAHDRAAVLVHRWDTTRPGTTTGPLPWLPPLVDQLATHAQWGPWLQHQADQIVESASAVRTQTGDSAPSWWPTGASTDPALASDVAVFRAAERVEPADHRVLGARQTLGPAAAWQTHLQLRVNARRAGAVREWTPLFVDAEARLSSDPFLPELCARTALLSRAGTHIPDALAIALQDGPLPDDHPAAALWWRLTAQAPSETPAPTRGSWLVRLAKHQPADIVAAIRGSRWLSGIQLLIDDAAGLGWQDAALFTGPLDPTDPGWSLLNRLATLTSNPTTDNEPDLFDASRPHDIDQLPASPADVCVAPSDVAPTTGGTQTEQPNLALSALWRTIAGQPEPSVALTDELDQRRLAQAGSPIPVGRLADLNAATLAYYQDAYPGSWAQEYILERFSTDLAGDARFRPGYAPAGWTSLVDHLAARGATQAEMLTAGVAARTTRGNVIDQFRDRIVFPLTNPDGTVLGFIGRRHPDTGDTHGPKYLNTRTTILFHKSAHLFGGPTADATPVLVEGPMDAIAVTLAGQGQFVGVAPLGTALTEEQARIIAAAGRVIVATDNDRAGRAAADKAYWQLTAQRLDPLTIALPDGTDPADLYTTNGFEAVRHLLNDGRRLGDQLLHHRLAALIGRPAATAAADVIAAAPPPTWEATISRAADQLGIDSDDLTAAVDQAADRFTKDPIAATSAASQAAARLHRLEAMASGADHDAALQAQCDLLVPGITRDPDWSRLAASLGLAEQEGHHPIEALRLLVQVGGLGTDPARELDLRLNAALRLPRRSTVSAGSVTAAATRMGLKAPRPTPGGRPR